MKKVLMAAMAVVLFWACTKDNVNEQEQLAQPEKKIEKKIKNQIESVDGKDIHRPGSGGGNG